MQLLATLLCLAAGLADHEGLHPSDRILYAEVPDFAAVRAAYDDAPLFQLLRDEDVRKLLEAFGFSVPSDTDQVLAMIDEQLDLPVSLAEWIDGTHRLSFSLAPAPKQGFAGLALADFESEEIASGVYELYLKQIVHEPLGPEGYERIQVPGRDLIAWTTRLGPRLVLGFGEGSAEAFQERASHAEDAAAATPASWKAMGNLDGTTLFRARWLGSSEKPPVLGQGANPLATLLNQAWSSSFEVGSSFRDGIFETRFFCADLTGFVSSQKSDEWSVDRKSFEELPGEAMLTFVTNVDGARLATLAESLAGLLPGGSETLTALQEQLGFPPQRVFARLGPGLAVSMAPIAGLGLPPTYAWIDCEDPDAFLSDIEALANALGSIVPGITARTRDYRIKNRETDEVVRIPYTTVTLPPDLVQAGMLAPKPSFSKAGKRVLMSLSSVALKSELKRTVLGTDGDRPSALDRYGPKLPEKAYMVAVMDWPQLFGKLMGFVKSMAPMMGELPVDPATLPGQEFFERYFEPTVSYLTNTEKGMVWIHRSSFGPEILMGVLGASVANAVR